MAPIRRRYADAQNGYVDYKTTEQRSWTTRVRKLGSAPLIRIGGGTQVLWHAFGELVKTLFPRRRAAGAQQLPLIFSPDRNALSRQLSGQLVRGATQIDYKNHPSSAGRTGLPTPSLPLMPLCVALTIFFGWGCSCPWTSASSPQAASSSSLSSTEAGSPISASLSSTVSANEDTLVVGLRLPEVQTARKRIASALENPRGLIVEPDGSLLVAAAGKGDEAEPLTGRLLRLRDHNHDGDYDDSGERETVLDEQLSVNIVEVVGRDEVFGMAAAHRGGASTLVSHALFDGTSTLFEITGDGGALEKSRIRGNLNHLAYHPGLEAWFAVSSSVDQILRITPQGESSIVSILPPLTEGQDAVPGYLRHDPTTEKLLVSFFSGSPLGESAGTGIELERRAGGILELDPVSGNTQLAVGGLTAPTDFVVDSDGTIYALEFCDEFLDPMSRREDLKRDHVSHGGFRRFSGRLLRIRRDSGAIDVLAKDLETPTNLTLDGRRVLVSQGMGTPGRMIPHSDGPMPLVGFIESIALDE